MRSKQRLEKTDRDTGQERPALERNWRPGSPRPCCGERTRCQSWVPVGVTWGAAPGQGVCVSSQPTPHPRATGHPPGGVGGSVSAERGPLATPLNHQLWPLAPRAAGRAGDGTELPSWRDYRCPREPLAHENRKRWEKALHLPLIVVVRLFFARRRHPAASPPLCQGRARGGRNRAGGAGLSAGHRTRLRPPGHKKTLTSTWSFRANPGVFPRLRGPGRAGTAMEMAPSQCLNLRSGRGSRGTQRSHPIKTVVTLGELGRLEQNGSRPRGVDHPRGWLPSSKSHEEEGVPRCPPQQHKEARRAGALGTRWGGLPTKGPAVDFTALRCPRLGFAGTPGAGVGHQSPGRWESLPLTSSAPMRCAHMRAHTEAAQDACSGKCVLTSCRIFRTSHGQWAWCAFPSCRDDF